MSAAPIEGRFLFGGVWTGSRMIVHGGQTPTQTSTNTLAAYDPATNTWETLPSFGTPRYQHAMAWGGDKLFVFGGYSGSAHLNDLIILSSIQAPTVANESRCDGGTLTFTATNSLEANQVVEWSTDGVAFGSAGLTSPAYTVNVGTPITRFARVRNTLSGCTSTATTVTGTAIQLPPPVTATNESRCNNGTLTFTATNTLTANQEVEWSTNGTTFGNPGLTSPSYTVNVGTPITRFARIKNTLTGCVGTAITLTGTALEPDACPLPPVTVTSTAGQTTAGMADGTGPAASFYGPQCLHRNSATGNYFVADVFNHAIRIVTPAGVVTTAVGNGTPGFVDGPFGTARFNQPTGLAFDAATNRLYVADRANHAIRVVDFGTSQVSTLAGNGLSGFVNAQGSAARFHHPIDLILEGGFLYVTDLDNHALRRISLSGDVTTLCGNGSPGFANGTGSAATFRKPWGLVAHSGFLYIADQANHAIRKVNIGTATVETLVGGQRGFANGNAAIARLNNPTGITYADGFLYVTDHNNRAVRRVTLTGGIITLSGDGTPGLLGRYLSPMGIAPGTSGVLYVVDAFSHRVIKLEE